LAKNVVFRVQKYPKNYFFGFLSKGRLNLLAKYSEPKKQIAKKFFLSELQELEVRICVQPNFPIIIPILLNGFHKFQRSRGLYSSVPKMNYSGLRQNKFSHCLWNAEYVYLEAQWELYKSRVAPEAQLFLNTMPD